MISALLAFPPRLATPPSSSSSLWLEGAPSVSAGTVLASMRAWYLLALPIAQAVLVNHTIDDEQGDSEIQFSPTDGWSQGSTCPGCRATMGGVSPKSAFNGTWHDSTHHPGDGGRTVTLSFSGESGLHRVLLSY